MKIRTGSHLPKGKPGVPPTRREMSREVSLSSSSPLARTGRREGQRAAEGQRSAVQRLGRVLFVGGGGEGRVQEGQKRSCSFFFWGGEFQEGQISHQK